ncbi:MAG: alpha/beta fold hydrolase [Candidatus Woesearchaeota archaeon]
MKEEKIYFENRHGQKLCGILTVPEDTGSRHHIVVLAHGFTSSKESSTYPFMARKLYEAGILSLRFDFYGHGESEGKFEDITLTEGSEDIQSAIDFAGKKEYVEDISLFGTSFGGVCTILAAARHKDKEIIKAAGLKAPAADMVGNRKNKLRDEGFREWKKKGFAEFPKDDGRPVKLNYSFIEDGEMIDAFEEAKSISCPVLIVHGDSDESVPVQQSEKLADNIKDAKLEIIKGADHHFDRPGEKERINTRFVEFFREVLT